MKWYTIVGAIVTAIGQLVALSAGQARLYALCMKTPLGIGYAIVYLPLIVGLIILVGVTSKLLPPQYSDEAWAIGSVLSSICLYVTVFRLALGKCSHTLSNEPASMKRSFLS